MVTRVTPFSGVAGNKLNTPFHIFSPLEPAERCQSSVPILSSTTFLFFQVNPLLQFLQFSITEFKEIS